MESIIKTIFYGWVCAFFFMSILWFIGKKIENYAIVDVGWGLCISLVSFVYFSLSDGYELRKVILLSMVFLWGIRLSLYLFMTRIAKGHKDKRYATFQESYGDKMHRKFFTNIFQLQAVLAVILASPLLVGFQDRSEQFGLFEFFSLVLFILSISGETIADIQLYQFRKNSQNNGKVCQVGLWNYSRHPNYFFEWLIWVSFSIYCIGSPYGYFAILSPFIMYFFLTQLSGVKLSEKYSLKSKGEIYKQYQNSTSSFFLWFKKEKI